MKQKVELDMKMQDYERRIRTLTVDHGEARPT